MTINPWPLKLPSAVVTTSCYMSVTVFQQVYFPDHVRRSSQHHSYFSLKIFRTSSCPYSILKTRGHCGQGLTSFLFLGASFSNSNVVIFRAFYKRKLPQINNHWVALAAASAPVTRWGCSQFRSQWKKDVYLTNTRRHTVHPSIPSTNHDHVLVTCICDVTLEISWQRKNIRGYYRRELWIVLLPRGPVRII
jgi:hypothetical protein